MNPNAFKLVAVFFSIPLFLLALGIYGGVLGGNDIVSVFWWIILPFGSLISLFLWFGRNE
jgi:hypothetical protein